MSPLRVSILQTDITWENKQENLRRLREKLEKLRGETEIAVLPETFSTGFSMNADRLAEPADGPTLSTLRRWAAEFDMAIAGSYIACDAAPDSTGQPMPCHNRGFFLTPEGESWYYDKHHLFRMGNERAHFQAGNHRLLLHYRGWNILLLICYDLRFPVWSRNVDNEYDLLVYVANWPASRRNVWDTLLRARALENQAYVCGVNRIGCDAHQLRHNGGSIIYSPKGEVLAQVNDDEEGTATASLDLSALHEFRTRFPAWKDADPFKLL